MLTYASQESVIYSPPGMLLVALSATMRNVQDIRDWFVAIHGPTGHAIHFFFHIALVCGSSQYTAPPVMRYFIYMYIYICIYIYYMYRYRYMYIYIYIYMYISAL